MTTDEVVRWALFGAWILEIAVYTVSGSVAGVEFKRRYFAWHQGCTAFLFLAFVATMVPPWFFLIFVAFALLGVFLNVRNTRFCRSCGKTVILHTLIARPRFCYWCGSLLSGREPGEMGNERAAQPDHEPAEAREEDGT